MRNLGHVAQSCYESCSNLPMIALQCTVLRDSHCNILTCLLVNEIHSLFSKFGFRFTEFHFEHSAAFSSYGKVADTRKMTEND